MGKVGTSEILIIAIVILLVFGPNLLQRVKGMIVDTRRGFKRGVAGIDGQDEPEQQAAGTSKKKPKAAKAAKNTKNSKTPTWSYIVVFGIVAVIAVIYIWLKVNGN